MPSSSDLWNRMDAVYKAYEGALDRSNANRELFRSGDVARIHRTAKSLIDKGLLGDPAGENMYFLTSNEGENPTFMTKRGSGQLEAFWRSLEKICTGPMCSPETIDNAILDFVIMWNLRMDRVNLNANGGKDLHTCDVDLLFKIKGAAKKLDLMDPFPDLLIPADAKKLSPSDPIAPTEFWGAGHDNSGNEAVHCGVHCTSYLTNFVGRSRICRITFCTKTQNTS